MTNESAFPVPDEYRSTGMSLRDYFAAQAMNGILSNCMEALANNRKVEFDIESYCFEFASMVSHTSYALADAMLTAREPKVSPTPE